MGSVDQTCDTVTGMCDCETGYTGDKCDSCEVINWDTWLLLSMITNVILAVLNTPLRLVVTMVTAK